MTWTNLLLLLANILSLISTIYFKKELRKTKRYVKRLMNQEDMMYERYKLAKNEADNLRKRINQTYNKPIF